VAQRLGINTTNPGRVTWSPLLDSTSICGISKSVAEPWAPFAMIVPDVDERVRCSIRVHVDLTGSGDVTTGDLISTAPYPGSDARHCDDVTVKPGGSGCPSNVRHSRLGKAKSRSSALRDASRMDLLACCSLGGEGSPHTGDLHRDRRATRDKRPPIAPRRSSSPPPMRWGARLPTWMGYMTVRRGA
jgi:hypothetical protein